MQGKAPAVAALCGQTQGGEVTSVGRMAQMLLEEGEEGEDGEEPTIN